MLLPTCSVPQPELYFLTIHRDFMDVVFKHSWFVHLFINIKGVKQVIKYSVYQWRRRGVSYLWEDTFGEHIHER
jgi:hypothetical protein